MKDNKSLIITTALFAALLFLSSTASDEQKHKSTVRPAFWGSSPEPQQQPKRCRKSEALHKRLDRFSESQKNIDADIAEKRKQIRRSSGSKKESYKRQLRRLQQRRDRIAKRIDTINADIKRIERKK